MQNDRINTDIADKVTNGSTLIIFPYDNHTWTVACREQCRLDTGMLRTNKQHCINTRIILNSH